MTINYRNTLGGLALSLALTAAPAFSQGLGVGVGGQSRGGIGTGAGVGVRTGSGIGVGAGSTEINTRTVADVKAGKGDARSEGRMEGKGQLGLGSRIESNPGLAARVQTMLPSGSTTTQAAAGFKNEGQFLAALHAAQNLNIPFNDLKTRMTGEHSSSLGAAIKESRPTLTGKQAKEEAKKAEVAAKATAKASASLKP